MAKQRSYSGRTHAIGYELTTNESAHTAHQSRAQVRTTKVPDRGAHRRARKVRSIGAAIERK
jgi:hypothetical protein